MRQAARSPIAAIGTAAILAALAFVLGAPPAGAEVDGACTMTVQGQDLAGDGAVITAPSDGNLTYAISASVPIVSWAVTLHYGPLERLVLEEPFAEGTTHQEGVFSVQEHTRYGTGLYRVTGEAELADGSTCTGVMDLRVEGSPFTTVLGVAAVAVLGAAGVGILLLILQVVLDAKDVVDAAKDFRHEAKVTKAVAASTGARVTTIQDVPAGEGEAGEGKAAGEGPPQGNP